MPMTEFIKKFQTGDWMRMARKLVKNPQQLCSLGDKVVETIKEKGLKEVKEQLMLMKDYVVDIAKGRYKDYRISSVLMVVAGLVYVVTPVDLIPDFLTILGWTDDVVVVRWVFSEIRDELQRYKLHR